MSTKEPRDVIVLDCPACGGGEAYLLQKGLHLEARCALCDRYIKFVDKRKFAHVKVVVLHQDPRMTGQAPKMGLTGSC